MTLEYIQDGRQWAGELINDIRHPRDIETKWTAEELAGIGLRVSEPPAAPPPIEADVEQEADRRLYAGIAYDFGDTRGVHEIRLNNMDYWRDVAGYAGALIDTGDTDTLIEIVTDTGPVQVTAPEFQALMLEISGFRLGTKNSGFALQGKKLDQAAKQQHKIPMDYKDDKHWQQFKPT